MIILSRKEEWSNKQLEARDTIFNVTSDNFYYSSLWMQWQKYYHFRLYIRPDFYNWKNILYLIQAEYWRFHFCSVLDHPQIVLLDIEFHTYEIKWGKSQLSRGKIEGFLPNRVSMETQRYRRKLNCNTLMICCIHKLWRERIVHHFFA